MKTAISLAWLFAAVTFGFAGGDALATDCEAHCDCMADTCSAVDGYPYPQRSDCLAACEAFSAEETACWPKWCARARNITDRTPVHLCEHAWGKLGLKECEKHEE